MPSHILFVTSILDLSETWASLSSYLVQSRHWQGYSTRSRDIPSSWHSHALHNSMDVISPSGPRVSFHHVDEQILISIHTPQATPSEYMSAPLWSPYCGMMVDEVKVAYGDSYYIWFHGLRISLLLFHNYRNNELWFDRVAILIFGMSIISFSQWNDLIVNWHKCLRSGNLDHRMTN
jgi:hypothetical protein